MNRVLQDTLGWAAESTTTPPLDLRALVHHGERRLRNRRRGAVAAAALAVVVTIAAPVLWADLRDEPRSVDRPGPVGPTPTPGDEDPTPRSRPLVWAEGSVLHVGDRALDIGFTPPFWPPDFHLFTKDSLGTLRGTDDGAVFATLDGRIWFSDGVSMSQIGSIQGGHWGRGGWNMDAGYPDTWIRTDSSGSRVVWMDPAPGRQAVVSFDTSAREVVARIVLPLPPGHRIVEWDVYGDDLYWRHFPEEGSTLDPAWVRTSLSTRTSEPTTAPARRQARATLAPALVVGDQRVSERDAPTFTVRDHVLVGLGPQEDDRPELPVRDPGTGRELSFRMPALKGLDERGLTLFSWLDEDRFALSATPTIPEQRRDIVVCRVSTEVCRVVVRIGKGPWLVLPWAGMPG